MRPLRIILPIVAVLLTAQAARAQHCWPSSVGLVVRDSSGAVMDAAALDSVAYSPQRSEHADFRVEPWRVTAAGLPKGLPKDSVTVLLWYGRGRCRVEMDEVVLREGGREMRLRLHVRVDTELRPGPSSYLLDLPPFTAGTFELDWADRGGGRWAEPLVIPVGRWRRVDAER
jgi:hypothetical protein